GHLSLAAGQEYVRNVPFGLNGHVEAIAPSHNAAWASAEHAIACLNLQDGNEPPWSLGCIQSGLNDAQNALEFADSRAACQCLPDQVICRLAGIHDVESGHLSVQREDRCLGVKPQQVGQLEARCFDLALKLELRLLLQ